jgi:hypothetical protein
MSPSDGRVGEDRRSVSRRKCFCRGTVRKWHCCLNDNGVVELRGRLKEEASGKGRGRPLTRQSNDKWPACGVVPSNPILSTSKGR